MGFERCEKTAMIRKAIETYIAAIVDTYYTSLLTYRQVITFRLSVIHQTPLQA